MVLAAACSLALAPPAVGSAGAAVPVVEAESHGDDSCGGWSSGPWMLVAYRVAAFVTTVLLPRASPIRRATQSPLLRSLAPLVVAALEVQAAPHVSAGLGDVGTLGAVWRAMVALLGTSMRDAPRTRASGVSGAALGVGGVGVGAVSGAGAGTASGTMHGIGASSWLDLDALVLGVQTACTCYSSTLQLLRAVANMASESVSATGGKGAVSQALVELLCARCCLPS